MDSRLGANDGNRLGVAVTSCEGLNVGIVLAESGIRDGETDNGPLGR